MIYINEEKIKKIKLEKDNFYVAIDFDKTITARESCDSWYAAGNGLSDEYNIKANMLKEKFEPIELDYNISFEEKNSAMEEWYGKSMDLFYEFGLTEEKLAKSIDTCNLIFRNGAKEFLEKMHDNKIPVIILSAGIGNVIERFLKNNNCYFENIQIISNFLEFDDAGKMKEYDNIIIHTLNKTTQGHLNNDIINQIKNKEYRFLIGDFIEDKNMVPSNEWERTVMVRILR